MCPSGRQILKDHPPAYSPGSFRSCPSLGTLPQCFPSPRWLCNASIDTRTRKWAVEGLAYLTLDADVKDDFVQDIPALQAMFELAKASVALTSGPGICWIQAHGLSAEPGKLDVLHSSSRLHPLLIM